MWNVLQCERIGVIGLRQGNCEKVGNCGQVAEIRREQFWMMSRSEQTHSEHCQVGKAAAEEVTLSGQGEERPMWTLRSSGLSQDWGR